MLTAGDAADHRPLGTPRRSALSSTPSKSRKQSQLRLALSPIRPTAPPSELDTNDDADHDRMSQTGFLASTVVDDIELLTP